MKYNDSRKNYPRYETKDKPDDLQDLKNEILSKLEFLNDRVSYKNALDEIVVLNAIHRSKNYRYQLSVTLLITKAIGDDGVFITGFKIQGIDTFRDNGEDPPFRFTEKEIDTYIDFR